MMRLLKNYYTVNDIIDMRKIKILYILNIFFFIIISNAYSDNVHSRISFWNKVQKGTNIFNQHITREDIKAAKDYGITFVRLSPDTFPTLKRDFLIGNADDYTHLVHEDLQTLKKILDICNEERMPVILTMLSLPGSRWKQNNNNKDDLRLWTDLKFQKQAANFWKDLALELRNHPAIVGYNLLNEPHLERLYDATSVHINKIHSIESQNKLFDIYKLLIAAVRSVDQNTPIILDSSAYGDPHSFRFLKIHTDPNILYSFHMYEPYEYTNYKINKERLTYPGKVNNVYWNKEALRDYMQPVIDFQKTHNIPSNRILVGEFGGYRKSNGLPEYFRDLIHIFTQNNWHFAFFAFRQDTWDGMDYELGDKKLPWRYWQDVEKGITPKVDRKDDYPQFKILKDSLL